MLDVVAKFTTGVTNKKGNVLTHSSRDASHHSRGSSKAGQAAMASKRLLAHSSADPETKEEQ